MRWSRYLRSQEWGQWSAIFHELHPDPLYLPADEWRRVRDEPGQIPTGLLSEFRAKGLAVTGDRDDRELAEFANRVAILLERDVGGDLGRGRSDQDDAVMARGIPGEDPVRPRAGDMERLARVMTAIRGDATRKFTRPTAGCRPLRDKRWPVRSPHSTPNVGEAEPSGTTRTHRPRMQPRAPHSLVQ